MINHSFDILVIISAILVTNNPGATKLESSKQSQQTIYNLLQTDSSLLTNRVALQQMQILNTEESLQLDQQIDEEMQIFLQTGSESQSQSKVQVKAIGDFIRWVKCIFKDCASEDAKKDHESAEVDRKKQQEEKNRREKEEAEKRKADETRRQQEKAKSEQAEREREKELQPNNSNNPQQTEEEKQQQQANLFAHQQNDRLSGPASNFQPLSMASSNKSQVAIDYHNEQAKKRRIFKESKRTAQLTDDILKAKQAHENSDYHKAIDSQQSSGKVFKNDNQTNKSAESHNNSRIQRALISIQNNSKTQAPRDLDSKQQLQVKGDKIIYKANISNPASLKSQANISNKSIGTSSAQNKTEIQIISKVNISQNTQTNRESKNLSKQTNSSEEIMTPLQKTNTLQAHQIVEAKKTKQSQIIEQLDNFNNISDRNSSQFQNYQNYTHQSSSQQNDKSKVNQQSSIQEHNQTSQKQNVGESLISNQEQKASALIANQISKEMEEIKVEQQMKDVVEGNNIVIQKQNKDIQKQEQEINHEYESGKMNAINSVIKQTFQNKTVLEEPKKFIVTDEQKKIIDQAVLDSMVGNSAFTELVQNTTKQDKDQGPSQEKNKQFKNQVKPKVIAHSDFRDKKMLIDHPFLHQHAKEGIRNITLQDKTSTNESQMRSNTTVSQSNAVTTQNHSQERDQYVSSWSKVQDNHKSDEQKQQVQKISEYVKQKNLTNNTMAQIVNTKKTGKSSEQEIKLVKHEQLEIQLKNNSKIQDKPCIKEKTEEPTKLMENKQNLKDIDKQAAQSPDIPALLPPNKLTVKSIEEKSKDSSQSLALPGNTEKQAKHGCLEGESNEQKWKVMVKPVFKVEQPQSITEVLQQMRVKKQETASRIEKEKIRMDALRLEEENRLKMETLRLQQMQNDKRAKEQEQQERQEILRRAAVMESEMLKQKQKQIEIQEKIKKDNIISQETIKVAAQIEQELQGKANSHQESQDIKKDDNAAEQSVNTVPKQEQIKDIPDSDDDTIQGAVKGAANDAIEKRKNFGSRVIDKGRIRLNEIQSQMVEQKDAIDFEEQILKQNLKNKLEDKLQEATRVEQEQQKVLDQKQTQDQEVVSSLDNVQYDLKQYELIKKSQAEKKAQEDKIAEENKQALVEFKKAEDIKKLDAYKTHLEAELKAAMTSPQGLTGSDILKDLSQSETPVKPKSNQNSVSTDSSNEQFIKSLDSDDFYDVADKKENSDQSNEIDLLKRKENQRITQQRQEGLEQLLQKGQNALLEMTQQ